MLLTSSEFKRLVKKELSRLDEGCGSEAAGSGKCGSCASGGGCGCSTHDDHHEDPGYDVVYSSEIPHPDEIVSGYSDDISVVDNPYDGYSYDSDNLSREETLDMVERLAAMTSCPKTRQALLNAVEEVEYATGESGLDLDMNMSDMDIESHDLTHDYQDSLQGEDSYMPPLPQNEIPMPTRRGGG